MFHFVSMAVQLRVINFIIPTQIVSGDNYEFTIGPLPFIYSICILILVNASAR